MYYAYLMRYNAFVGLGANIQGTPMLPMVEWYTYI